MNRKNTGCGVLSYGKGFMLFFNAPLEEYYAKTTAIDYQESGYEKIYAYAAKIAGVEQLVVKTN